MFRLSCNNCFCSVDYSPDANCHAIGLMFRRGSPNIKDTLTFTCRVCHTRMTMGIDWQVDLYSLIHDGRDNE